MEATEVAVKGRRFQVVWFLSERSTHCVIAEESRGTLFLGEVCRTSEDEHDAEIAMRESARKACSQVKGIKAWLFHEVRLYLHQIFTADGWRVTIPITGEFTYSPSYFPITKVTMAYDDIEDTTRILR